VEEEKHEVVVIVMEQGIEKGRSQSSPIICSLSPTSHRKVELVIVSGSD
jgi:hypothetical protein